MTARLVLFALTLPFLAACEGVVGGAGGGSDIGPPPEAVQALAAPGQNLATVRLREEDGCYWYLYDGPVESTLLPLRSAEGRPICARPPAGAEETVTLEEV